ncbi:28S ribosomal protein S5, mitochondrial [Gryllus bimaculatus]|nr:28S ribosomal protein S5, mitochondrial [Gryllus bimaculatus]
MWKNAVALTQKIYLFSRCNGLRPISGLPCSTSCRNSLNNISRIRSINIQPYRCTSFFNKLPADHLWSGVTGVSNAGKKRGRGKGIGRKSSKDLNRGQVIGVGKANIVWPGLNAPIIRGRELVQHQQLPPDPEREKKLEEIRNKMGVFKPIRLSPMERGWSGSKMPGRSIGPPDSIGEDNFEGFDTKVLELKLVVNMSGNFGRKRRVSSLVVTGNGNGLAGFAMGKANDAKASLRTAKNRAGQKLVFVDIYKNHTVYHDFFCQFGKTKIFVQKKPEGYGLHCHRAIKTMCEVIGIKDLHAKIEGPTNLGHIIKAFFLGLVQQKTHKALAEEKKLHLVEFRKENGNYPEVVASPTKCRSPEEIPAEEVLDYTQVRLHLMSEYGEIRSFLTDKYPECKPFYKSPTEEVDAEN